MPNNDTLRRLNQALVDLRAVTSKLADLNRNWVDPPDPDKPAARSALDAIKGEAAVANKHADDMILKL
jgi:hypothetical protein